MSAQTSSTTKSKFDIDHLKLLKILPIKVLNRKLSSNKGGSNFCPTVVRLAGTNLLANVYIDPSKKNPSLYVGQISHMEDVIENNNKIVETTGGAKKKNVKKPAVKKPSPTKMKNSEDHAIDIKTVPKKKTPKKAVKNKEESLYETVYSDVDEYGGGITEITSNINALEISAKKKAPKKKVVKK